MAMTVVVPEVVVVLLVVGDWDREMLLVLGSQTVTAEAWR